MYTISREFRHQNVLREVLYKLCEMVGARLRINELVGNVVSVHVHDKDRNCSGKDRKLGHYLNDGRDIYQEEMSQHKNGDDYTAEVQLLWGRISTLRFKASDDNEARTIARDCFDKHNDIDAISVSKPIYSGSRTA